MMRNVIAVRNDVQAALLDCELLGQISDGYWENAKPYNHYRDWIGATIVIEEKIGTTFYPMRKYDFANTELLSVVGDRMLKIARLANNCGYATAKDLHDMCVFDLDGNIDWEQRASADASQGTIDYYDRKREKLAKYSTEEREKINRALHDDSFTMRELRRELRNLNDVQKTRINA